MSKDSIHIHTPQKRQQMDVIFFTITGNSWSEQTVALGESLMKHEGVKQSWLSNGGGICLIYCTLYTDH